MKQSCYQAINYVTACLIFDRDAANWPKTIFCVNHLLFKKNICISRIFSISIKFSVKYINEESWRFFFVICLHTPFFHKYLALISRSNDILTVMCIQNFEELNYWGICLTTLEISHDARYICNFYIVKLLGIEVFRGKMRTCLDILLWWMRIDKTLQRISNLCTYL